MFQPQNLLPKDRRRCSLSRLPLIDHGLSGRADASGQSVRREAEPTAKGSKLLIVVGRNGRQGRRIRLLSAESAVVRGHELLRRGAGGQSSRPAKHGLHREVGLESSCSDGGLQRADVNAEFLSQLAERQQFMLSLVVCDHVAGTPQHCDRDGSSPAIPWAKGLERHRQERSELCLSQTDRSAQIANLVHAEHTMPFQVAVAKRPPAFLAGDHDDFPVWHSCGPQPDPPNHSGNLEMRFRADVARTRQTGHFFRFAFAEGFPDEQKSANSLGHGAPAATRTRDPRLRRPVVGSVMPRRLSTSRLDAA